MLAQTAGSAGVNAILTALAVLFVGVSIIGLGRRLAIAALLSTVLVLYVGYRSACWPASCGDGLIVSVWDMFWGSLRILWDAVWDAIGADSFANRLGMGG